MLRFLLLIAALVLATALVATHGVRGILFLIVLAVLAAVPRTRGWRWIDERLVRLTGSRLRGAALVMMVVIGVIVAVNLYEVIR